MSLIEQYIELSNEDRLLSAQRYKVAHLRAELVDCLRRRALELAEHNPEVVDVITGSCFSSKFSAVGSQWCDDDDYDKRVVVFEDGSVHCATGDGHLCVYYNSEVGETPIEHLLRDFAPLFDE